MQGPGGLLNVMTIPPGAGLGQRIVIDGFRGAMFEYDASNNLVSSWASTAGTDPYGHAYPAGFSIGPSSSFSGTDFVINSNGEFFYSGVPAAGNLVSTNTNNTGTDPFGNAYLNGLTEYGSFAGNPIAINVFNGMITVYSAATQAGPWTSQASIASSNTGAMTISGKGTLTLTGGSGAAHPTSMQLPSGGSAFIQDGQDGIDYNVETLTYFGSALPQTINSTTPATITGISFTGVARKYRFRAVLLCTQGAVGAAIQDFKILGPAASAGRITAFSLANGASVGLSSSTAPATAVSTGVAFGLNAVFLVVIEGWWTFSAGGTVSLQAGLSVAGDTFVVDDAFMVVQPS